MAERGIARKYRTHHHLLELGGLDIHDLTRLRTYACKNTARFFRALPLLFFLVAATKTSTTSTYCIIKGISHIL